MSNGSWVVQVPGIPRPQGSKRHLGGGRMIESSPHVKQWRQTITNHATIMFRKELANREFPIPKTTPIEVYVVFWFPRPKRTPKDTLFKTTRPDVDKLLRAVLDGLTDARVWEDDSQVVRLAGTKMFTQPDNPAPRATICFTIHNPAPEEGTPS